MLTVFLHIEDSVGTWHIRHHVSIFHLSLNCYPPTTGHPAQIRNDCSSVDLYSENPMNREAWQATIHGVARVGHSVATQQLNHHRRHHLKYIQWLSKCFLKCSCFSNSVFYPPFHGAIPFPISHPLFFHFANCQVLILVPCSAKRFHDLNWG